MISKKPFDKPALSIEDQISLLEKRNLVINNIPEAFHYLSTIGYYRLMGYAEPFLLSNSHIKGRRTYMEKSVIAVNSPLGCGLT